MRRPAEATGVAGSLVALVAYAAGVDDPQVLVAAATTIGVLPAVVTLLVANGGVRGVARLLWTGRKS